MSTVEDQPTHVKEHAATRIDRAFGTLLGACAGDSLGAQVEFSSAGSIRGRFPQGVREMTGGGPHGIVPGQVTDDSELALSLARSIAAEGDWIEEAVASSYVDWILSHPFDVGGTCGNALHDVNLDFAVAPQVKENAAHMPNSEANGSLMRASPLGVLFARKEWEAMNRGEDMDEDGWRKLLEIARNDSLLTHANKRCQQAVAVYSLAIGFAINYAGPNDEPDQRQKMIYAFACRVNDLDDSEATAWIAGLLHDAKTKPTENGDTAEPSIGWVKHGFQNAFYQLLHAPSFEDGIVNTIALGGDTDTNAAIAGGLLGSYFGAEGVPARWKQTVLNSRSRRPSTFHADDLPDLAKKILLGEQ